MVGGESADDLGDEACVADGEGAAVELEGGRVVDGFTVEGGHNASEFAHETMSRCDVPDGGGAHSGGNEVDVSLEKVAVLVACTLASRFASNPQRFGEVFVDVPSFGIV